MLLPGLTHYKSSKSHDLGATPMHSPASVKCLVFEPYGSCGGLLPDYGAGPASVPGAAGLGG